MTNKTYVWLTEEHHGYNFIFSSWEKAFDWLEGEKKQVDEDELEKLEIDIEYGVHAYISYEGDLVGSIQRYTLDEQF